MNSAQASSSNSSIIQFRPEITLHFAIKHSHRMECVCAYVISNPYCYGWLTHTFITLLRVVANHIA